MPGKQRDPAFLYYDADVALDVAHMNRLEKGCYLDLVQLYRRYHGYTMVQIRYLFGNDFDTCWNAVSMALELDGDKYHIPWLRNSLEKKALRNEKQRENIQKRWNKAPNGITNDIPRYNDGTTMDIPPDDNGNTNVIPIIETETETETNMTNRTENLFFGDVPEDLIELAGKLLPGHRCAEWHDYVQEEVEKLGYRTDREVTVRMEDDTDGRVDLVAYDGSRSIAIELDNRTARAKSILKVKLFPAGMVLLRDPKLVQASPRQDDWNQFPGQLQADLELPDLKARTALELLSVGGNSATMAQIARLWKAFKGQNFNGETFYHSANKVYTHFINWAKSQKINGETSKFTATGSPAVQSVVGSASRRP